MNQTCGNAYYISMPEAGTGLQRALRDGYPGTHPYHQDERGVLHYEEGGELRADLGELMGKPRCNECERLGPVELRRPLGDAWHAAELAAEILLWNHLKSRGADPEHLGAVRARRERIQTSLEEWAWAEEVLYHLEGLLKGEVEEDTLSLLLWKKALDEDTQADLGGMIQDISSWRDEEGGSVLLPTRCIQVTRRRNGVGSSTTFEEAGVDEGDPVSTHHTTYVLWRDGMRGKDAQNVARMLHEDTGKV